MNDLGVEGGKIIGDFLANNSNLIVLNLGYFVFLKIKLKSIECEFILNFFFKEKCSLTSDGVESLCEALKSNTTLETIDLSFYFLIN